MEVINPETDVISYDASFLKRKSGSELPNQTHKKFKTDFNETKPPIKSTEIELEEDDEPFSDNESSDPKHNEASMKFSRIIKKKKKISQNYSI